VILDDSEPSNQPLGSNTTRYVVRPATLADLDTLVRHRIGMFTDMGSAFDDARLAASFREWLIALMPSGGYRAWLIETDAGEIAAGGGITVVPWPPGPRYPGDRLAFVYNVYTEASHRRRGLARRVMETIHAWCRANGVVSLALNASRDGQPLYEAMGYVESPAPMMFVQLT
jgi:GNAT superfamily N-acetyltransferase